VEKYSRAGQATDNNKIRSVRFACWINKAKNTHSEYVIIIDFLLQQWLHDRASTLRLYYYGGNAQSNTALLRRPG
jgi:hypothetical protein